MGNSKHYYIEGSIQREVTQRELAEIAHTGLEDVALTLTPKEGGYYNFIAAIYSCSMGADRLLDRLAEDCMDLTAHRIDVDWADVQSFRIVGGEVKHKHTWTPNPCECEGCKVGT